MHCCSDTEEASVSASNGLRKLDELVDLKDKAKKLEDARKDYDGIWAASKDGLVNSYLV